ncbi:MAG: guanylate kinase [Anaerofustis sp.]
MKGNLFVISGPSGSGKSTICKQIVKLDDQIRLSVSATTRKPREGEIDGVSYHFLSREEFNENVEQGAFYEYAHVYENSYGTLKKPVEQMRNDGFDVILEIEMQGAKQMKQSVPETILIFIMPPSLEELEKRLHGRNTETEAQIKMRFESAMAEISENRYYDYTVTNADLDDAVSQVLQIIKDRRKAHPSISET